MRSTSSISRRERTVSSSQPNKKRRFWACIEIFSRWRGRLYVALVVTYPLARRGSNGASPTSEFEEFDRSSSATHDANPWRIASCVCRAPRPLSGLYRRCRSSWRYFTIALYLCFCTGSLGREYARYRQSYGSLVCAFNCFHVSIVRYMCVRVGACCPRFERTTGGWGMFCVIPVNVGNRCRA